MYQVKCDDIIIYDLRDKDLMIISPKLTTEINKTGTFNFTIPPQNINYNIIKKLKSIVTIYQDGEEIWRGRVLNDKLDFYNRKQVECEGELAFLLDTIQRPFEFQGTPKELFEKFISSHNSDVEKQKRFKIRKVTVVDNNNYINRENSNYSNTWDAINDKLINTNGGYLETGAENEERYIDYISEYTEINPQTIEFGKNLLDITQYAKGEDIKTAIIPIGKDKLNISSVNGGKDYIYNETAVNLFGWIFDTIEYNDVTVVENLLKKGNDYLETVINEKLTIELSAVDLHYLNCDIAKYKKGDWVRVISIPHKLDKFFQVTKLSISLDDPKSSKLTLGQTFTTLTQNQLNNNKKIQESMKVTTIENEKVQKEVTTLKENVKQMDETIVKLPEEYVSFEKIKGRILFKGNIDTIEELREIRDMEEGDIWQITNINENYIYLNKEWKKLFNQNNYEQTIEDIITRLEKLEGGENV